MHRADYFLAIDACFVDLNTCTRFREESHAPLQQFKNAIINAANGLSFELSEIFQKSYEDVNFDSLQSELKLLETVTKQTFTEIKRVTSMETVVSILNYGQNGTHLLSNVLRLMRIYLLAPFTTASAERSFSVQRSLETYLGSTITEKRCNNILMLNMHKA